MGDGACLRLLCAACLAGIAVLGPLWVTGCAEPKVDRSAYVAVPPDFSLSVTVLGLDRGGDWDLRSPAEQRAVPGEHMSARFIVEPDGTLRAALGPGADEEAYPGQVRVLSRRQMLNLWRAVRNHGLISAEETHGVVNLRLVEPLPGTALNAISIHALGDRIKIVVRADEVSRVGEGTRRLIGLLRAYSWLSGT